MLHCFQNPKSWKSLIVLESVMIERMILDWAKKQGPNVLDKTFGNEWLMTLKGWWMTLKVFWKIFVKRRRFLVLFLSMLLASYWPRPWDISFKWIIAILSVYLLGVIAEHRYRSQAVQIEINKSKFAAASQVETNAACEIVARPHMHTFLFKDGVNVSDLGTVRSIFCSFAAEYGLTQSRSSAKKDRALLRRQIDRMLKAANFIKQVNRKIQDYNITKDNFEEVVDDMTSLMRGYCTEKSFDDFRTMIAAAVKRGLKLCATTVFEDSVNVLSVTEDHFFLVAFSLKIYRSETGWIVRAPVITGKYASFLLQVSTAEFMKAINIDVDKVETSGTTVVLENPRHEAD